MSSWRRSAVESRLPRNRPNGYSTGVEAIPPDDSGEATVAAGVFKGSCELKDFGTQDLANGSYYFGWRAPGRRVRSASA